MGGGRTRRGLESWGWVHDFDFEFACEEKEKEVT